jgi:hypothetical protein
MNIKWRVTQKDIQTVRGLVKAFEDNAMVQDRIARNLATDKPRVTRPRFWKHLVISLLTTQQRSGPDSAVSRFANTRPFLLTYTSCNQATDALAFFQKTLSGFGGLRRHNRLAEEMATNLKRIQDGLWRDIRPILNELRGPADRELEVQAADFIDDRLVGFGPKQARNLLQVLGLTRYEIPIDSRIAKWLNLHGFPVMISATALSDRAYYGFVMDGICHLAEASGVWPCVLDAAIFVSFDSGDWTKDNVGW